ncbi:MAG TPA: GrpB family protein [Gaiellaceae bacterium]|jgi:GrpB-like predicted nucleotidyltransferase (UPF0157 family)
MQRRAVVVPYSDDWPLLFEAERESLEGALEPWLAGGIHHVGSTAVPGLVAKPVIDMVAGVANLGDAAAARDRLETLGYAYGEHRPEAHLFRKPAGSPWWEATHALHLTEPGSDLWRERLAFRDAMRGNAELAAEYGAWKLANATGPGAPAPYAESKTPFVARVLADVGIDVRPDSKRLTRAALARRRA